MASTRNRKFKDLIIPLLPMRLCSFFKIVSFSYIKTFYLMAIQIGFYRINYSA